MVKDSHSGKGWYNGNHATASYLRLAQVWTAVLADGVPVAEGASAAVTLEGRRSARAGEHSYHYEEWSVVIE